MTNFYDLRIFNPLVMGEKFTAVKEAILSMILTILFVKLNDKQREIMLVQNYHYWDPNVPDKGRTQGLLQHLIFYAIGGASTFNSGRHFCSSLYLYDLKKFTGLANLDDLKKEIEDMNKRWQNLAELELQNENEGKAEIVFRLLS